MCKSKLYLGNHISLDNTGIHAMTKGLDVYTSLCGSDNCDGYDITDPVHDEITCEACKKIEIGGRMTC